jgi:hypothetical protein
MMSPGGATACLKDGTAGFPELTTPLAPGISAVLFVFYCNNDELLDDVLWQ